LLIGSNIVAPSFINKDTVKNPTRTRKLLLNQKEINTLIGKVQKEGLTLIPLSLYWNNNKVKLRLGVAKGKKKFDKRQSEKNKDWAIEKNRVAKTKLRNN
jgi:SsrA-binding protein